MCADTCADTLTPSREPRLRSPSPPPYVPKPWGADVNFYGDAKEDEETASVMKNGVIDWDNLNADREENEKKRWAHLPDLKKEFYIEHEDVKKRCEEEVVAFRLKMNNIEVKNFLADDPSPLMRPVEKFEEAFHNFPDVLKTIKKQGFTSPSPIQAQAWPYLLSGEILTLIWR